MCTYMAALLEKSQKVPAGKGTCRLENQYYVRHRISLSPQPGQQWPVLMAGRTSAINQLRHEGCCQTPNHGAVFFFMVDFKTLMAKWPGFKLGFKVCFSIGIFPSTDAVLFQIGFRCGSMTTRSVSESSCPERGSTPVSDLASKFGFRFSFRHPLQSRADR